MNIIDIIILACLALGAVLGFRDGAIRQLGTLAGIIVAIVLAKSLASSVSSLLGLSGDYAHIWGYVIVLVVSFVAVAFLSKLLRNIVSAVGLGIFDRIGGALVSAFKFALFLSLAFSLFNMVNSHIRLLGDDTIEGSKFYSTVVSSSSYIMPAIGWVGDQIPEIE